MQRERSAQLVLRIGAAFAFLYPPIDALFDPYSWIGYFPPLLHGILLDLVLLHGFGIVEVVIALWILSGKNIFWPSVVATLMLLAIVFFNAADFELLFRDLSIASITVYLAFTNAPRRS